MLQFHIYCNLEGILFNSLSVGWPMQDMVNVDASCSAVRGLVSFYLVVPTVLLVLAPEPRRSTKRNSMFREAAMNCKNLH